MLRQPFGVGSAYHVFDRGIDKRETFATKADFRRFMECLYLCNSEEAERRSDILSMSHAEIFSRERGSPLVEIGAYALMKNHFHLLLREIVDGGISRFMQKLSTSYTMYFNIKNDRVGSLFAKPFRSRLVNTESYYLYIPHYIHLNAAEIFEPGWKQGRVKDIRGLEKKIMTYEFSSMPEYYGVSRPSSTLLSKKFIEDLHTDSRSLVKILEEAQEYYTTIRV